MKSSRRYPRGGRCAHSSDRRRAAISMFRCAALPCKSRWASRTSSVSLQSPTLWPRRRFSRNTAGGLARAPALIGVPDQSSQLRQHLFGCTDNIRPIELEPLPQRYVDDGEQQSGKQSGRRLVVTDVFETIRQGARNLVLYLGHARQLGFPCLGIPSHHCHDLAGPRISRCAGEESHSRFASHLKRR